MSPEEELRFLVLGAQREGSRSFTNMLAPLGLTPAQAEVISCLRAGGAMSLNELGKLLVCETGSPSRLVDTLVGREIVARREDPADRRRVTLELTADGARLAAELLQVEDQLHAWIGERLGADNVATLVDHLRRITEGTASGSAIARRRSQS